MAISRQRKWQIKKAASNSCMICGKPNNLYSKYCDLHGLKQNELQRKRKKFIKRKSNYFTNRKKHATQTI